MLVLLVWYNALKHFGGNKLFIWTKSSYLSPASVSEKTCKRRLYEKWVLLSHRQADCAYECSLQVGHTHTNDA
jgi:hypothetical protein